MSLARSSVRLLLPPLLLASACVPVASAATTSAGSGTSTSAPAREASVSRGVCTTSPTDATARAVGFDVRMRDVGVSRSYGFVLKLEERASGDRWRALKGSAAPPGFGSLVEARPGAPKLVRAINVRGLRPGSAYRLRVTYRWYRADGTRSVVRVSRACTVKDVRPEVSVTGLLGWQPSPAGGEVAYRIGVSSSGAERLAHADVPVVVRQGDTVLASGDFRPAGGPEDVLVTGRRCVAGLPVTVELDPAGVVDERGTAVATASCGPVAR